VLAVILCAAAITGCGGGSSRESRRTATFVAAFNEFCSDAFGNRAVPRSVVDLDAARLRGLLRADHGLRSLRRLRGDLAAQRMLLRAIQGKSSATKLLQGAAGVTGGLGGGRSLAFEESYRLDLRFYDDERALGLTRCARHPPRPPIGG
jgi:hypothetical protein